MESSICVCFPALKRAAAHITSVYLACSLRYCSDLSLALRSTVWRRSDLRHLTSGARQSAAAIKQC